MQAQGFLVNKKSSCAEADLFEFQNVSGRKSYSFSVLCLYDYDPCKVVMCHAIQHRIDDSSRPQKRECVE